MNRRYGMMFLVAAWLSGCAADQSDSLTQESNDTQPARAGETAEAETPNSATDAPDGEFLRVPGNVRIHRSCVHEVSEGAEFNAATGEISVGGKVVSRVSKCPYAVKREAATAAPLPDATYYQAYSGADAVSFRYSGTPPFDIWTRPWFNRLDAHITVPSAPTTNGGTIFLWSGIAPGTGGAILQPVLQYGGSAAGGGNYWSYTSWYIDTSGNVLHGTLQPIAVGADFYGSTRVNYGAASCPANGVGCPWSVMAHSGTSTSDLNVSNVPGTWSAGYRAVAEVYNVTACNRLPASHNAVFSGIQAYQQIGSAGTTYIATNQTWQSVTHDLGLSGCTFGVTSSGQTAATLTF